MTEVYKIGGMGTDTLTGRTFKMLGACSTALNNAKTPFYCSSSQYQVTSGKTFYITGILPCYSSATTCIANVVYADDASFTTNVVDTGIGWWGARSNGATPTNGGYFISTSRASIPAGKYVGLYQSYAASSSAQAILYGYEE